MNPRAERRTVTVGMVELPDPPAPCPLVPPGELVPGELVPGALVPALGTNCNNNNIIIMS